jgi:radical SAM superfamily enzyme YgiQ (UPF0313 family)
MAMHLKPEDPIRCLLVQPIFADFSFWNYKRSCELVGAKTPSPPLGLITVAAILPQHWQFKLMDLNTRSFSEADWAWADMICVSGMLPQQKGILSAIARAKKDGKYVVVGGADPSSQPDIYSEADTLLVGEGENNIPLWLDSWRQGQPYGVFKETEKPDVTLSPCPRFDLLRFEDYAQLSVQYSRGCPFNCEFCDIIELFGRKPRTKTPEQVLRELSRIKELGYSGSIDMVDDNFIGNKRNVKRNLLPALIEWNKANGHLFYYATEASMNVADDEQLLELLRDADFRIIFMGIESPDPELLLKTQKSQNTMRPIVERVHKLYEYGIIVTAGFIMGFDGEKRHMDLSMIQLIEETGINMAMVGLLVALPNTQLSRRLLKENRLLSFRGELIKTESDLREKAYDVENSIAEVVDQTVAGLNFITTRNRFEIFEEYLNVVRTIYAPKAYMDRVLRVGKMLKCKSKHIPRFFEIKRHIPAFFRLSYAMTKSKETRRLYWRNVVQLVRRGPIVFEQTMRVMGIYLHFREQVAYLEQSIKRQISTQKARISTFEADYLPKNPTQIHLERLRSETPTEDPSTEIKNAG